MPFLLKFNTMINDVKKEESKEKRKSILYYIFDWFLGLLALAVSAVVVIFLARWIVSVFTKWFPSLKKYQNAKSS